MATYGLRGKRLQDERNRLHMTQGEFAVKLGITTDPESKPAKTTISRYEHGVHQPKSDLLDKMSEVLNVSADYLLGRTDDRLGVITEDGLPSDEIEVLHAYREKNSAKMGALMDKKHSESPDHKTRKA